MINHNMFLVRIMLPPMASLHLIDRTLKAGEIPGSCCYHFASNNARRKKNQNTSLEPFQLSQPQNMGNFPVVYIHVGIFLHPPVLWELKGNPPMPPLCRKQDIIKGLSVINHCP